MSEKLGTSFSGLIQSLVDRFFLYAVLVFWIVLIFLIRHHDNQHYRIKDDGDVTRIEIVFWHGMGGPLGRVMNDFVDRFNKQQSKYFVRSVNMGSYGTLSKKILASIVADEAPDIAQMFKPLTIKFIRHQKIVRLDDLIEMDGEDIKSDIIPVLLEDNTYDGRLYSFPFNKSVPVLYYNKDIFREVGLDPEVPPRTLTELASFSRHITRYFRENRADGPRVYGFGTSRANVWMFLNRVLQFGGEIVSSDLRKSLLHEAPAVDALRYLQEHVREGIFVEGQGFEHQNDFQAQRAAMIEGSIVSKVFMEPGISFDMGVAPLPGEKRRAVILSGSNVSIFDNKDPEKIKGAWEFIKWFTSTDISAEWSIRTTYLPVRKSSLESKLFKEAFERDPNMKAPYVQLDYCHFEPRLSVWFEIRDLMADYLELATIEMGPPETYLKRLSDDINGLLRHIRH